MKIQYLGKKLGRFSRSFLKHRFTYFRGNKKNYEKIIYDKKGRIILEHYYFYKKYNYWMATFYYPDSRGHLPTYYKNSDGDVDGLQRSNFKCRFIKKK